jgi:hypothetical protein
VNYRRLSRTRLQELRKIHCPLCVGDHLIVADRFWRGRAVDLQVGDFLLTPGTVSAEKTLLALVSESPAEKVWRAATPGVGRLVCVNHAWASYVRVARRRYEGRNQFRHLEEEPDGD